MEKWRKVQSTLPDMRISIPVEGNIVLSLPEIGMMSSSTTLINLEGRTGRHEGGGQKNN